MSRTRSEIKIKNRDLPDSKMGPHYLSLFQNPMYHDCILERELLRKLSSDDAFNYSNLTFSDVLLRCETTDLVR
jgi:hypothetical protein